MKIIHALVIKLAIQIGFQCDYCSEIIIDAIITHQLSLSGYAISRRQMYLEHYYISIYMKQVHRSVNLFSLSFINC